MCRYTAGWQKKGRQTGIHQLVLKKTLSAVNNKHLPNVPGQDVSVFPVTANEFEQLHKLFQLQSPMSATHTEPASHSFLSLKKVLQGLYTKLYRYTNIRGSPRIISDGLFFSSLVVFLFPGENVQVWILNTLAGDKTVLPSTVCHLISSTEVKACFLFPNSLSDSSQSGRLNDEK